MAHASSQQSAFAQLCPATIKSFSPCMQVRGGDGSGRLEFHAQDLFSTQSHSRRNRADEPAGDDPCRTVQPGPIEFFQEVKFFYAEP